jgi:hypothetical protein
MQERLSSIRSELAKMKSQDAADWLLKKYPVTNPDYGDAIELLSHLSFKRADQIRLAGHYLQKMPFASAKVYHAFLSIMSLRNFVSIAKHYVPTNKTDKSLMLYHLVPELEKAAKTLHDREIIKFFIADIDS